MLLDGESAGPYHDWQRVTPVLEKMLDETGLFAVTVVTAPASHRRSRRASLRRFANYRAVVMNYDAPDERWPAALKASFERLHDRDGGGLVAVHAADNAFAGLDRVQRDDRRRRLARRAASRRARTGSTATGGSRRTRRQGRPAVTAGASPFQVTVRDADASDHARTAAGSGCTRATSSTRACAVRAGT